MKSERMNIVFYFSDQQRPDTIGCYGQKLNISPNIDRVAEEGTVFEHAFSPQPVCGPCRAIFQSGLYATDTGCFRNNKLLPLGVKTLANYVEGIGYETAYVGKWHLASENDLGIDYRRLPVPREYRGGYTGFWRVSDVLEFTSDAYGGYIFDENNNKIEFNGYRCDCITDQAIEYLDDYDPAGGKPFFLTVSQIEPHHQNDAHHYQGPEGSRKRFAEYEVPGDLAAYPEGDWDVEYPDYLGACESIDKNFGRLVDKLKEKGLYDNTIIIFSSDHGSHFKTRNRDKHLNGYDDYKRTCHESGIHVPLVATGGPFKQGGKRVSELVSTESLPKTIATLCGCHVDELMIGERLQDVAVGNIPDDREDIVYGQISESRVGRYIRTQKWKYSVVAPGINGSVQQGAEYYVDDFLYDLENDPYELDNLVEKDSYKSIKLELRSKLKNWIDRVEHMNVSIED